tara:strand:- start:833 stop:1420 length:588 start_codon:yes stop_codon:yes gene_type:complete
MFLIIDNYDSFTYNLYHYALQVGAEVEVVRNDKITVDQISQRQYEGIIISPGPCTPNEAGICLEVVKVLGSHMPLFGVCLGHQTIGQVYGGTIVRADKPMHAKISTITHLNNSKLFTDIPESFKATRYHSLIVKKDTLPDSLNITATSEDGVIQAMEHHEHPVYGVQFHPESIASEHGHQLLKNFITIARERRNA